MKEGLVSASKVSERVEDITQGREFYSPVNLTLIPTNQTESYKHMPSGTTGIPLLPHPGAFGAIRKHDTHTGVDLYCEENTPVYAIESGVVVKVMPFTGKKIGMDWWLDTDCVMVEGETGVWLYGEISTELKEGDTLNARELVGKVKRVLRKDKGRPTAMLHLELMRHGARKWYSSDDQGAWDMLMDPTPHLIKISQKQ